MSPEVIVRPYEVRDRLKVRQIACDTADRGNPVESFFPHRDVVADLLITYYSDFEPEHLWIAEYGSQVVGYLTGCLDERRYFWMTLLLIAPRVFVRALFTGLFFRPETWKLLHAMVRTLAQGGFSRRVKSDEYPAHLHINVQQGFRGQHIGSLLMQRFFEQVRGVGFFGIRVSVRLDNESGVRFFKSLGFIELSRHPVVMLDAGSLKNNYTVIYGKAIA